MTCTSRYPLMNVTEVAELLGLTPKTVRRRVKSGKIPAVRVGKLIRIYKHDAVVLLRHHKGLSIDRASQIVKEAVGEL